MYIYLYNIDLNMSMFVLGISQNESTHAGESLLAMNARWSLSEFELKPKFK